MSVPIGSLKERLRKALSLANMKPIELSQKTNIPKSSISQYMSGYTKPNDERVYLISKALNVSEAWLMGFDVPMERQTKTPSNTIPHITSSQPFSGEVLEVRETYDNIYDKRDRHLSMQNSYNPIIHKIPVLGYISAGLPLYADEHIQGYTYTDRNGGAEYFALRVKGDSMNAAQINDGNVIIVRKQGIVENGEIAVVRVGFENATVKRYKQDGNIVQLIPQSFNPNHQIQIYNTSETEINIIGKVVECKIEF